MNKLLIGILLLGICLSTTGCATPGIVGTETGNTLTIAPVADTSLFACLFPAKLPAGEYEYQVSEHKKLKINTKADLKLINFDVNALKSD